MVEECDKMIGSGVLRLTNQKPPRGINEFLPCLFVSAVPDMFWSKYLRVNHRK
jgi:hypothetical protein